MIVQYLKNLSYISVKTANTNEGAIIRQSDNPVVKLWDS